MGGVLGERLRRLLKEQGLTVSALAESLGVSRQTVHRWMETGRLSERNLKALCRQLDVSESWLRYGAEPPEFEGGDFPSPGLSGVAELRRNLLRDLSESEQRLRAAMEAAQMVIWDYSLATARAVWSGDVTAVFAQAADGRSGLQGFLRCFAEADAPAVARALERTLAGRGRENLEVRRSEVCGGERWVELWCRPRHDPEGRVNGAIVAIRDISARKREERRLAYEHRLMDTVLDQVRAIYWTTDDQLRITSSRGAALEHIGLAPGQVDGMYLSEYLGSDEAGQPILEMHHGALEGRNERREAVWLGRCYEVSVEPLRREEGGIAGTVGIAIDVTEARQEALQFSDAQRLAHLGTWTWDVAADRARWSDELYRIFGYRPGALIVTRKLFQSHVHAADRDRVGRALQAALNGETEDYEVRFRIRRPDGSLRYLHARGLVVRDADGRAIRVLGITQDVTERMEHVRRLEQSDSVLRTINHGVLVTDLEGNITSVNPAFTRITGYGQEEVLGRNPRLLQSGRHDTAFYRRMWGDLLEKGCWSGEIWNRRKDGSLYREHLTVTVLEDALGDPSGYMGVFERLVPREAETAASG